MPSAPDHQFDFFLSRRGSVAAVAREVADVLTEKGYKVLVQDYDIPLAASFVDALHDAVKNSRDLVILFTRDYEQSPYTRKEFTSFEAERAQSTEERHIIVLRCENAPLRGLLADNVYQDLVGITDPEERRRRIIAAAERHSQAAPPPPRPFIGVPPRIASFTGRVKELDRLDAILMRDKPAAVTQSVGRAAVQGLGGVGKTSLATEYVHRYRQLYAGVCWCPAETRTELLTNLAALAVTLGVATVDEADVEKAVKATLRRLNEQRATWLLVYDNVADPNEMADLLPSSGARVLITSRFSDWSAMAEEVSLDVLALGEATTFLQSRCGRQDAGGASILAKALGSLPLALDHAAAYCRRTQMRFAEYATKASTLIAAAAPRGVNYPTSVGATFDLAISQAVSQCAAAEMLAAFLAHCAPERIPMVLIEDAINDEAERHAATGALFELSLLRNTPFEDSTPAVTVHRLVQAAARTRAQTKGLAPAAVRRLGGKLTTVYPIDAWHNPQSWRLCSIYTPHLLAWRQAARELGGVADCASLLNRAGVYFLRRGAFEDARQLLSEALAYSEIALGPEHPETARCANDLGSFFQESDGSLEKAQTLFERALAIREKTLGPEHPDTGDSVNCLAVLHQTKNDLATAQPLMERALAIREKTLGLEHPLTLQDLNNLAFVLREQRDFPKSRALSERALAICETALGPDHPETGTSQAYLGLLARDEGKLPEAQLLFERALGVCEKAFGPEHPETAACLLELAHVMQGQQKFGDAQPLYERALKIQTRTFGSEHSRTYRARWALARNLLTTGNPSEALALSEKALAIHDKKFGPTRGWTKDSARVTADALDALGRAEEARALREKYGITPEA
jgi:tetratricopeptide (TPR) repeat protein